jgi:MFS family permease
LHYGDLPYQKHIAAAHSTLLFSVLFLIWNILSALSSSTSMFIVMRIVAGSASASVQPVGSGSISDLWDVKARGKPMGIFFLGQMIVTLLSPLIVGMVTENMGLAQSSVFWGDLRIHRVGTDDIHAA